MAEPALHGWSRVRELLFRGVQLAFGWLVRALFRTARRGHELVPRRGGVILAFNHLSFLDPVLLELSIPRPVYYLAKRRVLGTRLTAHLLTRYGGHIALESDRPNDAALDAAVAALQEGRAIALAPEGTRSRSGRLARGKTGVATLGYRTGCPVYPIGITGTDAAWPPGKLLPRPLRATSVSVGEPIAVAADPEAADDPRRLRELTDRVMAAVAELCGEAPPERRRSEAVA